MESSASPQELNPCRAPVAILRPSWAMHHDNALPTVRRHNIFEFLSNKFKQSKAIYLYFFNSALSVYLRKSFFNHRQYNYYHRADARVSPRHQSLASCCSLVLLTGVNRDQLASRTFGPRTSRHPALGVSPIATRPSNHHFTPRAHGCLILFQSPPLQQTRSAIY